MRFKNLNQRGQELPNFTHIGFVGSFRGGARINVNRVNSDLGFPKSLEIRQLQRSATNSIMVHSQELTSSEAQSRCKRQMFPFPFSSPIFGGVPLIGIGVLWAGRPGDCVTCALEIAGDDMGVTLRCVIVGVDGS